MSNAGWETFEITTNNPANTELVAPVDGRVVFKASTDAVGKIQTTTFTDGSGKVAATLDWRLMKSDRLTLDGKKDVAISSWLKADKQKAGRTVSFTTSGGQSYVWKGFKGADAYTAIDLYSEGTSESEGPVATFTPSDKPSFTGETNNNTAFASLSLSPIAQASQNEIFLSFLILQKDIRYSGGTMRTSLLDVVRGRSQ